MKYRKLLLGILLGSLSIGSGILLSTLNKDVNRVKATEDSPASGVFVKVTSKSDIHDGDRVVFVSDGGYAIEDIWGNPGYLYATTAGIKRSSKGLVTLTNSPASVFTVVEQTKDNNLYFAFRTSMKVTWQYKENVYLAINRKEFDKTFENVAYFYGDRTAVDVSITDAALWDFNYVEVDENPDDWEDSTGSYITNVSEGGALSFTTQYATRFCRGASRVDMYKMVPESESACSTSIVSQPGDKEYFKGEEINLTGYEIEFSSSYHHATYRYVDEPYLFIFDKYASGSGDDVLLEVSFMGISSRTITLTVNKQVYYSTLLNSTIYDFTGEYSLISDYGRVLSGDNITDIILVDTDDSYKYYVGSNYENEVKFYVEKANGHYYLRTYNGNYMSFNDGISYGSVKSFYFTFEFDNTGYRIKGEDGFYLNFDIDNKRFKIGNKTATNEEPVYLYKYELDSDILNEVNEYADYFLFKTSVCDPDGMQNAITNSIWSDLSSEYNDLKAYSKVEFINKTYTYGSTSGDNVASAVERYDYVVSKYGTSTLSDFIGRINAGSLQNNYSGRINISLFNSDTDMTSVVVVIIAISLSIVLVTSFILRRKKQH